jgi:histone deacetylase complex regulatory component SIN3
MAPLQNNNTNTNNTNSSSSNTASATTAATVAATTVVSATDNNDGSASAAMPVDAGANGANGNVASDAAPARAANVSVVCALWRNQSHAVVRAQRSATRVFFGHAAFFVFFRLYQLMYERLST